MQTQELLQEYKDRGWNIIPLAPNSKAPIEGFDLDRAYTEKFPYEELDKLLGKYKSLNFGIMTGKTSGISVIDVDDVAKLDTYESRYPTGIKAQSARKGFHLYYEYDPSFPEIVAIDGGDFFSGKHYVVAPPSTFEGKPYLWVRLVTPGFIPKFDLKARELEAGIIQSGKYTRKEISELINDAMIHGMKDGQWNDTILYGSMLLASQGWAKDAISALMASLNKGKHPIPAKTVDGMIDRAVEYADKYTQKEKDRQPATPKASNFPNTNMAIRSYGEMAEKYAGYEAKWLVEGWILDSAVISVAAPPERFKTWLSIDLALSVASGLPFLDNYDVKRSGSVLIFQQEDFGARYFSRFRAIERAKLERAKIPIKVEEKDGTTYYEYTYDIRNRIFFHENSELNFDNEESIQKLRERIIETKAVLCIIDPFYSLSSSDDYFASAASTIRDKIKAIRNETGCAFLFVHHTRKAGTDDQGDKLTRSQAFGSQFVSAVMEGMWIAGRISGQNVNQIKVARFFKDETAQPETEITFHINLKAKKDEEAYYLDVIDVSDILILDVKAYLQKNGAQSGSELYKAFEERFTSRGAFLRWVTKQEGIMQNGQRGKYSVLPTG